MKHKLGVTNRVADVLSRRKTLLTRIHVEVMGVDSFCELLASNPYFFVVLARVRDGEETNFLLYDGFFFMGIYLCIPDCSLRS